MTDPSPGPSNDNRVVAFRRGSPVRREAPSPVEPLDKYEQAPPENQNDYRHRMIVNALALVFIVALVGAGLWLANSIADMSKMQDCVASGRRGCAPVEVTKERF